MKNTAKIAVVTGVSKGIGEAITNELLQNNFKVYGISRSKPKIKNDNFIHIPANITNQKLITTALSKIKEQQIDLLVNNAGVAIEKIGLPFPKEVFEKTFYTNFIAPITVTGILKDKLQNGMVINISSVSDRLVDPLYGMYCASKTALNRYFEALSLEETKIKFISMKVLNKI